MTSSQVRLKYVYRVIDRRAREDQPPLLAVSIHHGVVPRSTLTDDLPRAEDLSNYKLCEAGDLVLNRMRAFQGAIGISPVRGIVSPDYLVLRPAPTVEPRYLHHLFRSAWFVAEMSSRLRGIGGTENGAVRTPRINADDLGDIRVALPSFEEQRRIADFLDAETSTLNLLIEKREAQLDLLRRKRFSEVREVLMRGLRGSSRLSTSLGWLPQIPDDWSLIPLRYLAACLDGRRVPLSAEERASRQGKFPYFGASRVVDYVDDYLFDEPLVLLGEDGAQLANPNLEVSFYVEGKIWVNNHAHVLRPAGIDGRLLAELLNVFDRNLYMSGATREKITQDEMNRVLLPVPPFDQQQELVEWISHRHTERQRLEHAFRAQSRLLTERRQALITAAVTGQFDVSTASRRNATEGVPA
ncbi:restriction endonuclease subunit S [Streptomyces sp. NPDC058256]|uniref:restriction endonuclease subunit S n=1 Tax=Streptomyces sp. NPDC058256 TaxID=3346408 RepID=UPI0036EDC021